MLAALGMRGDRDMLAPLAFHWASRTKPHARVSSGSRMARTSMTSSSRDSFSGLARCVTFFLPKGVDFSREITEIASEFHGSSDGRECEGQREAVGRPHGRATEGSESVNTTPVEIRDPGEERTDNPNALESLALAMLIDPRDLPFVKLSFTFSLTMIPLAALMFVPGVFRWWMAPLYLAFDFFVFVDRCILMLHCTSHRPLFKPRYRLLNNYIPWVMGPLFGETPETYFGHHMGMHHPENNLEKDLSTTMPYQRDSFLHFLHYWATFMITTIIKLPRYLWGAGRKKMAARTLLGEAVWYGAALALLYVSFWPTMLVLVAPFFMVRFLMMWGNWGQHAFVDPARPENCYVNSITCINSRYNARCFNDGYHIGHHIKANRHYSDYPRDLRDNLAVYAKEEALVFEGLDFFMVSLFLFLKRYDWLADKYVQLGPEKKSRDEILALMKSRLVPIRR